jgi:hypothetical protein
LTSSHCHYDTRQRAFELPVEVLSVTQSRPCPLGPLRVEQKIGSNVTKQNMNETIIRKLIGSGNPASQGQPTRRDLIPIFKDSVSFAKVPISVKIKTLRRENESMLMCLRGEMPHILPKLQKQQIPQNVYLHENVWKVMN